VKLEKLTCDLIVSTAQYAIARTHDTTSSTSTTLQLLCLHVVVHGLVHGVILAQYANTGPPAIAKTLITFKSTSTSLSKQQQQRLQAKGQFALTQCHLRHPMEGVFEILMRQSRSVWSTERSNNFASEQRFQSLPFWRNRAVG
jgi:hypothetical protein